MAARGSLKRIDSDDLGRVLELGAREIYGWGKKRFNSWEDTTHETRSAYRARMQEMLNVLAVAGYEVRRP